MVNFSTHYRGLRSVISAQNPNGINCHFVTFLALLGYTDQFFWTKKLLLTSFSLHIQWFPIASMRDAIIPSGFWMHFVDVARHLVLPVLTLSSIFVALHSR